MSTRTINECQDLASAWLDGKKQEVIDELGGEPTRQFIADFGLGWKGDPVTKVYPPKPGECVVCKEPTESKIVDWCKKHFPPVDPGRSRQEVRPHLEAERIAAIKKMKISLADARKAPQTPTVEELKP